MLDVHLPPDLEARLKELARETGRSVDDYAREAIVEKIEELEDQVLAEQRNATDSGERIPLAEMMKKYAADLTSED